MRDRLPTIAPLMPRAARQVSCMRNITSQNPDSHIAALEESLSEPITQGLQGARKISLFYTHQVAAINALDKGKHVIVSTSTASGKSVIYQVCKWAPHTLESSSHYYHRCLSCASSNRILNQLRSSYIPLKCAVTYLYGNNYSHALKALAQDQKQALEQLLATCPGMENVKVGSPPL